MSISLFSFCFDTRKKKKTHTHNKEVDDEYEEKPDTFCYDHRKLQKTICTSIMSLYRAKVNTTISLSINFNVTKKKTNKINK